MAMSADTSMGIANPEPSRVRVGGRPQDLLLTLLGDYWYGQDQPLPLRALVAVLAEFGVSEAGARAAVNRLSRRGLLAGSKLGRQSGYSLTPNADRVLSEGLQRIRDFGRADAPWSGKWIIVAFSVPEHRRDLRHVLRTRLRWLGFAPLYDGTWVSPKPVAAQVAETLRDLDVTTAAIFEAASVSESPHHPLSAWDICGLRAAYDQFLEAFAPLLQRMRAGTIGTAEALVKRTEVMDAWRQFPNLDPELPAILLPEPWPRRTARAVFSDLYDGLAPLAAARLRQILQDYAQDLAAQAHYHLAEPADVQ